MLYRVDTDHHTVGMPESIYYTEAENIHDAIEAVAAFTADKYNHVGSVVNVAVLSDYVIRLDRKPILPIVGARDLGVAEEVPSENG